MKRVPTLIWLTSVLASVLGFARSGNSVHGQVLVTPTVAGEASVFRLSSVARAWMLIAPVRGTLPE